MVHAGQANSKMLQVGHKVMVDFPMADGSLGGQSLEAGVCIIEVTTLTGVTQDIILI